MNIILCNGSLRLIWGVTRYFTDPWPYPYPAHLTWWLSVAATSTAPVTLYQTIPVSKNTRRIVLHFHNTLYYIWELRHQQVRGNIIFMILGCELKLLLSYTCRSRAQSFAQGLWQETWLLMNRLNFGCCGDWILILATWLHQLYEI